MGTFFSMGGYAAFVWPCYALTLGGMLWLAFTSWQRAKAAARKLEEMSAKPENQGS